jgi:hypothetical protein
VYAYTATAEFVKRKWNSAAMPGEMSQMIPERPNAEAVRHQDRCGVIRNPRRQGFIPIVAHGTTPTDVVVEFREYPPDLLAFTTRPG